MSPAEVLSEPDVDESELTQQPCNYGEGIGSMVTFQCDERAVGEVLGRCSKGHTIVEPRCEPHMSPGPISSGRTVCSPPNCLADAWRITTRYYTGRSA